MKLKMLRERKPHPFPLFISNNLSIPFKSNIELTLLFVFLI